MGNEVSSAAALQSQLAELERAVSAQQRRAQTREHPLLPHQLHIDGAVIATRADVHVFVGPVVGRVECDSARVLLEVDADALVTCHVSALNALSDNMHELAHCRVSMRCTAGKPTVFVLQRLVPGRDYTISFSGICKQDAMARRGSFHTPSLESGSCVRGVVVSGDSVFDLARCESSLWRDVRHRIETRSAHVILHLGGQVHMARMFDQSSYRTQWSAMPDVRFVLAHASNLMLWSDADVYPAFTTRPELFIDHEKPTIQMQVVRTVTRCARQLYHEYQRQLWDDQIDELYSRERELVAVAERALATTAQIYQLAQQIPAVQSDLELQKKRREIEGARRVEKHLRALEADKLRAERQLVSYRELLAPQRGEEFVYCVGEIGFLFLDVRSARLEPGGSQASANDLLSNAQWGFIEDALASSSVQFWIVCSELPVLDTAAASDSDNGTTESDSDARSRWGRNPEAQTRLLEMLFDWKMAQSSREFVLLAGASALRFGAVSAVRDAKMRTRAQQFVTGAITASPAPPCGAFAVRQLCMIRERFEVEHSEVVPERAFLTLDLTTQLARTDSVGAAAAAASPAPSGKRATVAHVSARSHAHELACVLLGPVVGFVDASSAVVLLEVDRDADVICIATNPLTGETRRMHQRFRAKTPSSFYWTHLRAEHYYELAFNNVQHAERFHASFSTLARFPTRFELLALCDDNLLAAPSVCAKGDDEHADDGDARRTMQLWEAVADKVANVPFASVSLTLHLGGQFGTQCNAFIDDALALADAALASTETKSSPLSSSHQAAVDLLTDKLRQMYRLAWSLPGVRDTLAHGAHILLSNNRDELALANASGSDLLVQEMLARVHCEYQQLLLPPSKRGNQRALSHAFGAFGLFVLPVVARDGMAVSPDSWNALRTFLSTPALSVLLLVTQAPVVEHACEDVAERVRFDGACAQTIGFYERELMQLLALLFDWKRLSSGGGSSSARQREVVLVSGSCSRSFDSVIQEIMAAAPPKLSARLDPPLASPPASARRGGTPVLLQYVVGPMSNARRGDSAAEAVVDRLEHAMRFDQGTLGGKYSYHHFVAKRASGHASESDGERSGTTRTTDVVTLALVAPSGDDGEKNAAALHQLAHLAIETADKQTESHLRSHQPLRELATPAGVMTRWTLVCSQALEPEGSNSAMDCDVDERYRRVGRVDSRQVTSVCNTWELHSEQPLWLDKLLSEAFDSDESAQVEAIRTDLRDKAKVISESFEQVAALKSGLVTLRDARAFVGPITEALTAFYVLSGSAFRVRVGTVPSPFVISYSVEQLRQSERDAERSAVLGSVDASVYELLLERCVTNAFVLQRRLEKHWA